MTQTMNDGVQLLGVPVESPHATDMRFAALIWGPTGSGKTTLASTAPGHKLVLSFDPDGELSLADRADIQVMRFAKLNPITVVGEFRKPDPYGLTGYLRGNDSIETVVFDSMTTYAYMALQVAVSKLAGGKNAISMEQPSMAGYTYRNATVLAAATSLLGITAKLNRNIIFITHEGSAELDEKGSVVSITMILATNLANQIGLRLNEVWHLRDNDGKERTISVRPHSRMTPMKTRLFTADRPQFTWHFDANTMVGEGIADWWHAWKNNGGKKIPLPSTSTTSKTKGGMKK
jgi:hypothetical protein